MLWYLISNQFYEFDRLTSKSCHTWNNHDNCLLSLSPCLLSWMIQKYCVAYCGHLNLWRRSNERTSSTKKKTTLMNFINEFPFPNGRSYSLLSMAEPDMHRERAQSCSTIIKIINIIWIYILLSSLSTANELSPNERKITLSNNTQHTHEHSNRRAEMKKKKPQNDQSISTFYF